MPAHEKIRRRRLELGLSLEQLSARIVPHLPVMTKKVLSKIENNGRRVLADEVPYFARALECRPDDLLDEDSE
jgi:transcriptional regulator with XRE-family HTH domain